MHHLYGDVETTGLLATWSDTCWRCMARTLVLLARRQEVDRKVFFTGFSRESVITAEFSISKLVELHIPIHEKNRFLPLF
jgi:hypothetical protein